MGATYEMTEKDREELAKLKDEKLDELIADYFREGKYIRKNNFGGGQAAEKCELTALIVMGFKCLRNDYEEVVKNKLDPESFWAKKYEEQRKKCDEMERGLVGIKRFIAQIALEQFSMHESLSAKLKEIEDWLQKKG